MNEPTRPTPIACIAVCVDCRDVCRDTIPVGHIEQGSGPGHTQRACLHHARQRANLPDAPDWLGADICALDQAAAARGGQP